MDLITVVVPVYNIEKYIKRCVESIMRQTHRNLQIILVDDGSTDNSKLICDELALKDKRIEVYHKMNGGLSSARNYGIEKAKGCYIGFVDGDDYIEEDMYEILYGEGTKKNADVISCGYYEEFGDKKVAMCYSEETIVFDKIGAYKALFSNKALIGCSSCNKLFRIDLFKDLRYKLGIQGEDLELIYRLLDGVNKVVCVNKIKYHYAHRADSITTKSFDRKYLEIINITNEMVKFVNYRYPQIGDQAYAYQLKWLMGGVKAIISSPNRCELKQEKRVFDNVIKKNFRHYWKNPYIDIEYYVLLWANLFHIYIPTLWLLRESTRLYHLLKGKVRNEDL